MHNCGTPYIRQSYINDHGDFINYVSEITMSYLYFSYRHVILIFIYRQCHIYISVIAMSYLYFNDRQCHIYIIIVTMSYLYFNYRHVISYVPVIAMSYLYFSYRHVILIFQLSPCVANMGLVSLYRRGF